MTLVEHLFIARGYFRHIRHEYVKALFLCQCSGTGSTLAGTKYNDSFFHLIFKVMMVNAARIIVTIQKRMVIFDSWNGRWGQPFSM